MSKIYLGEALGLLGKTMPFIWVRLGSYLLLGLGLGIYLGIVGSVAWMLGSLWGPLGLIVFLAGIGGAFAIVSWATRYYFYLLKAAHASVLTEIIVFDRVPEGSQLDYGRKQVTERFRDTSIMFAVDALVDGAVKTVVRTFTRIAGIVPIPGVQGLGRLLERVAVASTTFVDESILSRAYAKREQNVWRVAHDGVVLYAQAWKPILTNAVVLALLGYIEFFLLLAVLGLPAVGVAAALPGLRLVLAIAVVLGAWMIKLAVADALAMAATLLAYHRSTAGMEPDAEWVAKLEGVSDKFRELGRKAVEGVRGAPETARGSGDATSGSDDGRQRTPIAEGSPAGASGSAPAVGGVAPAAAAAATAANGTGTAAAGPDRPAGSAGAGQAAGSESGPPLSGGTAVTDDVGNGPTGEMTEEPGLQGS